MPVVDIQKDTKALTMRSSLSSPRPSPGCGPPTLIRDSFSVSGARRSGRPHSPGTTSKSAAALILMTGPKGEKSSGYWEFLTLDEPRSFEVKDGFLGADGKPVPKMPSMRMRFAFEPHDGGTRMTTVTTFPSAEALEQLLNMGMEEGLKAAMAQIDGVLAAA